MKIYYLPDASVLALTLSGYIKGSAPLAEQQMKTPISVTLLPLELGQCLYSCSVDVFIIAFSEVLAVSEGWVSGLAASICASRELVSWSGDWKTRAAAARTEWGQDSDNFSLWGDTAFVFIRGIRDPLKKISDQCNGKPLGGGGILTQFTLQIKWIVWGLGGKSVKVFQTQFQVIYFIRLLGRRPVSAPCMGPPTVKGENTWDVPGQVARA